VTERDHILQMDDEELSRLCRLEFFKGSGNGGQKRNKTSSAARVTLLADPALTASDCSGRSQHDNRSQALFKLRMEIACHRRLPFQGITHPECSVNHAGYPLFVAQLLDLAEACRFDHQQMAVTLGISPTAMVKKIGRDSALWQFFNKKRQENALNPLILH